MSVLATICLVVLASLCANSILAKPVSQFPFGEVSSDAQNHSLSADVFADLEELSRIVDVSYCVGTTGIQKPFLCASRCQDFKGFELITVSSAEKAISRALTSLTTV